MGIRARAATEGALPEFGGSKRGCCAARVVIGDAVAAERDLGTRQSQAAPRSRLLGPRKLSCCCLMGGKQAGAKDFQLLLSQDHPQPFHQ